MTFYCLRTSAWFGDLKDGVHKGDANDPRVSIIQVIPDEIRYWYSTKGKIGRAAEIGVHAITGKTATPGELRTITKDEVIFCLTNGVVLLLITSPLTRTQDSLDRRFAHQVIGTFVWASCQKSLKSTSTNRSKSVVIISTKCICSSLEGHLLSKMSVVFPTAKA